MSNYKKLIQIGGGIIVILFAFFTAFGLDAIGRLNDRSSNVLTPTTSSVPKAPETTSPEKSTGVMVAPSTPAPITPTKPIPKPTTVSGYTLAQISAHNSATSCYVAINAKVYNLTTWVNRHPGGKAAILMICGKDGSALFNNQHGRSSKVATILATYYIGALI